MAKIKVVSDVGQVVAEVVDQNSNPAHEPYWRYFCKRCLISDTDRGHFEDTVEAASIHVDRCGQ